MSYIDVLYLGLLLVAFLGFAAALFYFWRRWSNRNPPTRLESKRFRRGENSYGSPWADDNNLGTRRLTLRPAAPSFCSGSFAV